MHNTNYFIHEWYFEHVAGSNEVAMSNSIKLAFDVTSTI